MAEAFLGLVSTKDFNKLYVLKVLRSDIDDDRRADFLQMFQDEGRLAARLNHPHIVQSHEMGCEGDHYFIAMEYLEGQPFSRIQEQWESDPGCFPLPMRLFVVAQLLDALDYAHTLRDYDGSPLNLVHRDVSPQNVFVTYAGHSKLLDFGIAKTLESRQTRGGVLKGKIPYMAPEQVRGARVDQRTDLFGVGVILWECIAGRSLQADENDYDILRRLAEGDLPRLETVVTDLRPELERIVTRALSPKPADRYPDARSMREELLRYAPISSVTTRDIAAAMQALFGDEREEIARLISDTIRESSDDAASPESRPLAAAVTHGKSTTPRSDPTPATQSTAPLNVTAPPTRSAPARARAISNARLAAIPFLVAAGISAAVLALSESPRAPHSDVNATVPSATAQPSAAASASAPPSGALSEPTPPRVHVRIAVEPRAATLTLDGTRLSENPFVGTLPRDGAIHTLRLSAPGYQESVLPLTFDHDVSVSTTLTVAPSRPEPMRPPRAAPPARKRLDDSFMKDLPPPPQSRSPVVRRANEPR